MTLRPLLAAALLAALPAARAAPQTIDELLKASPAGDWRPLDPRDTLYLELPAGRVVIELAPAFAPHAADAIRKLVKAGYFDGAGVMRSQDNYVVQWGRDENDAKAKAQAPVKLAAEFDRPVAGMPPFTRLADPDTYAPEVGFAGGFPVARDPARKLAWLTHCYGMVGVGRDNSTDSGNGSELYAVIGQSPRNLDRNVTLVGRVVQGMEWLSVIPRGPAPMGFYAQPGQWVPIRKAVLAADLPEGERLPLEALRTDSATVTALVANRRARKEAWYANPVGHIGVCNVPLPVRPAGS